MSQRTLSKSSLKDQLTKMSSKNLLTRIAIGKMNSKTAKIAATIIERRFPTPKVAA